MSHASKGAWVAKAIAGGELCVSGSFCQHSSMSPDAVARARNTRKEYKALGIDTFEVVMAPNPCQECKDRYADGKGFAKTLSGKEAENDPPLHPGCRCTLIAVFDETNPKKVADEIFAQVEREMGDADRRP